MPTIEDYVECATLHRATQTFDEPPMNVQLPASFSFQSRSPNPLLAVSDNAYRKDEIVQMEAAIILKLDFRLNSATSFAFLAQCAAFEPRRAFVTAGPHGCANLTPVVPGRFLEAADVDGIGDKTLEYLARYLCELALQV